MKTQDEIVKFLKRKDPSFFGFDREVLLQYLDFAHAKEFLKEGVTEEEWKNSRSLANHSELTREHILEEMKTYMRDYGWPKTQDHRGISANRTIEKMEAWGFIIEGQEFVDKLKSIPYPSYGAQKLKWICEKFGFPIPDDAETVNMMNGKPCVPTCHGCLS